MPGFSQPSEDPHTILVAIPDPNIDRIEEGDAWTTAFEATRVALEREVGFKLYEADIGPGASLPAFVALLPISAPVTLLLTLFFAGKPINENLDHWIEIGKKLRKLFVRPPRLNRQGAAVLAIQAIIDHINHLPKSIRLESYRPRSLMDDNDLDPTVDAEIYEAPETLFLGFVEHDFHIEADGVKYRVTVDGSEARVSMIS